MTTRHTFSLPLGLALLALPGAFLLERMAVAAEPGAAAELAAQEIESRAALNAAITAALQKFDTRTVEKLLKDYPEWGERDAVTRVESLAWHPNERVIEQMKPFRTAWKEAYGDEFLTKMEKILTGMPASLRRKRGELLNDFDQAYAVFLNLEAKSPSKDRDVQIKAAGADLELIGDAMQEIGDPYYASLAHFFAGLAHHESRVGEQQDVLVLARCLQKMAESRDLVDHEGESMVWVRLTLKQLEEGGIDPEAVAAGEPGTTSIYKFGESALYDGAFRILEAPTEVARPGFATDAAYVTWPQLQLFKIGTTAEFGGMAKSPEVTRVKDAVFEVKGTDGTTSTHQVTGKVTLVETTAGDPPHPFAFFFQVGNSQDFFQGIQVNLQPNADYLGLYSLPACGMTFQVNEVPVTVFDDNADGIFGTKVPLTYNYVGMTKGEFQPDMDTVLVGKAKRAVPFSEFLQIEDTWYKFEAENNGAAFRLAPVEDLKTGELVLRFSGPDPEWLILKGEGDLENCYFDLTTSRKLEVPVGRYSLYYGGFREGVRSDGIRKAIVVPGKSPKFWSVSEDEATDVELGEPFDIDFKFTANDARVTVIGQSLTVTGKAGERYHRLWNLRLAPEAQVRKAGKGKGAKGGRMALINDQNTLNDKGYEFGWKPLDLEVENRYGTDAVEVRLVEKKNKLFGKLESSWRSN